jgi:hypothetical protein
LERKIRKSESKKIKNKNQKAGKQKTKTKSCSIYSAPNNPPKEIMDRKKKKGKGKKESDFQGRKD